VELPRVSPSRSSCIIYEPSCNQQCLETVTIKTVKYVSCLQSHFSFVFPESKIAAWSKQNPDRRSTEYRRLDHRACIRFA